MESREQELFVLEAAFAAEDDASDFEVIMIWLELPEAYCETLKAVLRKGLWRKSKNPKDSLRQAVYRAALRSDRRPPRRMANLSGVDIEDLGALSFMADSSEAYRDTRGVWRQGMGMNSRHGDRPYHVDDDGFGAPDICRLPRGLVRTLTPAQRGDPDRERIVEDTLVPNWRAIAKSAGLDEWEAGALEFMGSGCTLYRALQFCKTTLEKRSMEAAWKRLKRSGFAKVREILRAS